MKVKQFLHANQFLIHDEKNDVVYLQSYDSTVAKIDMARNTNVVSPYGYIKIITLGYDWDYSKTTSTHVFAFLEKYGNVSFSNVSNKRQYVNKLISEGVIYYDENM